MTKKEEVRKKIMSGGKPTDEEILAAMMENPGELLKGMQEVDRARTAFYTFMAALGDEFGTSTLLTVLTGHVGELAGMLKDDEEGLTLKVYLVALKMSLEAQGIDAVFYYENEVVE